MPGSQTVAGGHIPEDLSLAEGVEQNLLPVLLEGLAVAREVFGSYFEKLDVLPRKDLGEGSWLAVILESAPDSFERLEKFDAQLTSIWLTA